MRILVISNVVPYPAHSGIQLRILRILERVARVHQVTLCCHAWSAADQEGAHQLSKRGIRTFTGRMGPQIDLRKIIGAAGFGITGRPPELALYRSPDLTRILRELLRDEEFDILQVEETILAHYADLLPRGSSTKRLLTFHDLHFVQAARAAPLEHSAGMRLWRHFNSFCMRFYEPRVVRHFERCATVTEHDRQLLQPAGPRRSIAVVPNGVDTTALRPLTDASTPSAIVFVGSMFYKPCEDGALWLVREILPLVRRQFPEIDVWIVGKGPGPRVKALAGEHVFVTGEVEDVVPYYQRAAIALAPLRAGSGSRLKILEAMALGRPVVATSIGAEGLEAEPERHLLIADGAKDFAAAVVRLLQSPDLCHSLATASREFVEARYNWEMIAACQLRIYREMTEA
jgi:glycosyltransferase involved in cell wall biosynthesis